MIPFTIPTNSEVINLNEIVRMSELQNGSIDVCFSNGERLSYSGQAAEIVKGAIMLNLEMYHQAIAAMKAQQSQIVTPQISRIM